VRSQYGLTSNTTLGVVQYVLVAGVVSGRQVEEIRGPLSLSDFTNAESGLYTESVGSQSRDP